MINTWRKYEQYGEYPNGRSYDDQPIQLMEDWALLDQRFSLIYDGLKANEHFVPPGWEAIPDEDLETPQVRTTLLERLQR